MPDNIIRFGILGCGTIARFHADAIGSIEDAELVGCTSVVREEARRFSEQYHIRAYADYAEMLADPGIDAVCICTPSGFHADNAMQALRAKKHVVLEKPMAFTREQTREICAEADKSGCKLTVICQLRFAESVRRVKKLVEENAFGKLVFCDLYMKYWRSPEYYAASDWRGTRKLDGGGALMNQGIHGVDMLLYLVGNARVVYAKTVTRHHDIEVEDAAVAALEFENGAAGVIEGSTCAWPGFERRLEINGTRGCAVLVEDEIEKLVIDGENLVDGRKAAVANTASDPAAFACDLHAAQLRNFIDAIRGEGELLIPADEGARAVALIEDIYRFGCVKE